MEKEGDREIAGVYVIKTTIIINVNRCHVIQGVFH